MDGIGKETTIVHRSLCGMRMENMHEYYNNNNIQEIFSPSLFLYNSSFIFRP